MASFRSQSFDLEDNIALASARQLSAGNSNGTNPDDSGQIRRGQSSTSSYGTKAGKVLRQVAYIVPIIWCANKITTDPLFLYYYVIYDDSKCFDMDEWMRHLSTYLDPLGIAINVASLCSLVLNVIMKEGLLKKWFEKIVWFVLLLIDLWSYIGEHLRYKQVMNLVWPYPGISNFYSASVYLVQYFGTVCLMYITFTRATRMSATLARATWAKAAFNLLLYLHGGHVFGGLWYAFAVVKYVGCWKEVCKKYALPSYCTGQDVFLCGDVGNGIVDYMTLNEKCPTKTRNTTIYNFGIYYDALDSGIVEMTYLHRRILHCLRWGLQNLSGFGQNLQVSTDAWENIFVISITIYGLALFVFFIGNMQMYLQLNTQRSEKIRQKKREIEKSKFFAKLPRNLQRQIKSYQPEKWEETKDVHFEDLFNNVPDDIKKNIKHKLCLEIVKKVQVLSSWSDEMLDELCDRVKPVSYAQCAQIIQKDNKIHEMLFFVHGKLQTYSWQARASASTQEQASLEPVGAAHRRISIEHLEDGMFCGEELVNWFRVDPYSSNLPKSIKTIQTLTKVNAFALMSYDLQNLFIKHQAASASTQEQSPASASTQEQSSTSVSTQEQSSAGASTQEQSPASASTQEQSPASASTKEQSPASASTQEQSSASASTQEQSSASASTQEQSPASASTQEQSPASASTYEQAPLAESLPQTPVESQP